MRPLLTASAVALAGLVGVPCLAGEPPARRPSTSVALLGGYGFQLDSVLASGVSAYRFGFGTRAGVTLPCGAYLGGAFVTHTGTNVAGARGGAATYVSIAHASHLGPEIGFDFALWRLLVRPSVGSGLLVSLGKTAVATAEVSDDHAYFFVAPGTLVAYRFGDAFAGVDLSLPIVPAQPSKQWAATALLTLGTTFGGSSTVR